MKHATPIAALVLCSLLLLPARAGAEDEPKGAVHDGFREALTAMGLTEAELGYAPKAHWPRYPHSKTVPYVLPFFDDLLANPLDTYMFTRTLGNAVEDFLVPALLVKRRPRCIA